MPPPGQADDETISTGGTIATLVDRGARVTVLTCTRGERGEVIPPQLAHLEGSATELAARRTDELADAMAALGVTDQRFLGAPGARWPGRSPRRYTDSGMRWGASGAEALDSLDGESLCAADFAEVAADIASVVSDVGATAVVSYDENGGYGQPDHVLAHDAARKAAEVVGVPFFAIGRKPDGDTIDVDVAPVIARKVAALRAHATQVTVDGDSFSLSSGGSRPIARVESFWRVREQQPGPVAWKEQGVGIHVFAWLLALVVGAAVGGIATVNHQLAVRIGGWPAPLGIVITLAIVAALLVGARIVFEGRSVAACATVGLLGTIAVLSVAGSGGSILVPANPAGYALTFGPLAIAVVALAWPRAGTFRRGRSAPSPR